jgi:hypothetical protein
MFYNKNKMKGKIRKIDRIFWEISKERGHYAEKKTEDALSQMLESGEIVSFYKTNKKDDKFRGIDFFVISQEGEKIPIQIKSSFSGAKTHLKEFPNIPVIVIELHEDLESIKNKIRNLINKEENF